MIETAAYYAERMAAHPGHEAEWAIARIRVGAGYEDDATFRRLVEAVIAGMDLAEQRRRVAL